MPSEAQREPVIHLSKPTEKEREGDVAPSTLQREFKRIAHRIGSCNTVDELNELLEENENIIEQFQRRFKSWWETGEEEPPEFVPLKTLISETRSGLYQYVQKESW